MDEPATEQPPAPPQGKARLYLFGLWRNEEIPEHADPTPIGQRLIDFFTGAYKGPLSEREAELVLQEFASQEQYRQRLLSAIQQCSGALQQKAAECVKESGGPVRVSGTYSAGMSLGRYVAFSDAAQAIMNTINSVALETHAANIELTKERKAKLEGEHGEDR